MTEHEHPVIHADAWQQVAPAPDSRLAQLHAAYPDAKAAADDAAEKLAAIKDGIKAELAAAVPEGSTRIALTGEHGPALQLVYSERWSVDSRKLKREDPETYVRYARMSGAWTLSAPKGGGSE